MTDRRWLALALVVVSAIASAVVMPADWVSFDAPGIHRFWERDASTWPFAIASWSWIAALLVTAGSAFAMIAGARRDYVPRLLPLVTAILVVPTRDDTARHEGS